MPGRLRLTFVSTALALLIAFGLVVPAFGVPDPLELAEKALKRSKSASKTAKRAKKTAKQALQAASAAYVASAAGPPVHYVTQKVLVGPGQFKDLTVVCPTGLKVAGSSLSTGAVIPIAEAVAPQGVIFSGYNPSTTAYSYWGQVQCLRSSSASFASSGIAGARRQAAEAKRAFQEARAD